VVKGALAFLLLALLAARCGATMGPVWARPLEGRVIDEVTGAPVPGAIVHVFHDVWGFGVPGTPEGSLASVWTHTDADGRFVVPGRLAITWLPATGTVRWQKVVVFHPDYGTLSEDFERDGIWTPPVDGQVRLALRRNRFQVEAMRTQQTTRDVCYGLGRSACREACRIVYWNPDRCSDR